MGNFNNYSSNKAKGSDNRSFDQSKMHPAVCSKCGNSCQVPFKPTGNRPIFCSNCFKTEGGMRKNDERGPRNINNRQMFDAICDKCGSRCQIPFQPRPGKQVFCSHCFEEKEKGERTIQSRPQDMEQLNEINAKLDKILALLAAPIVKEKPNEEKVVAEKVDEIVKDEKKPAKKSPAKKKTVKKA
jgi:CxxC-x17-CxxC domain-containing protein